MPSGVQTAQLEALDHQLDPPDQYASPPPITALELNPPDPGDLPRYSVPPDPLALTEVMDFVDYAEEAIEGYADIRIFPDTWNQEFLGTELSPTSAWIMRPYLEVLELLRMNNNVLMEQRGRPADYTTWNHVDNPVVYIYTLEHTFAVARFLWSIYLTAADLKILFLPDIPRHPPPYSTTPPRFHVCLCLQRRKQAKPHEAMDPRSRTR